MINESQDLKTRSHADSLILSLSDIAIAHSVLSGCLTAHLFLAGCFSLPVPLTRVFGPLCLHVSANLTLHLLLSHPLSLPSRFRVRLGYFIFALVALSQLLVE